MRAERAMRGWCVGVMLFGAVLVGGAFAGTDRLAAALLERFGGVPLAMTPALRFAVGQMGAVSLGWGASLLAVATISADLPPDQRVTLWRRIGLAVLGWYLVDSVISVATGFWPNAISNTLVAGLFWLTCRRM